MDENQTEIVRVLNLLALSIVKEIEVIMAPKLLVRELESCRVLDCGHFRSTS
jgi:hypothetical protein